MGFLVSDGLRVAHFGLEPLEALSVSDKSAFSR
jgi:hypothetical protein